MKEIEIHSCAKSIVYSGYAGRKDERRKAMLEEIRKALQTGLGAVILTKEKAEEISRKMVKEAKLSKEDANTLKQELLSSGERQWKEMEQSLSAALKKAVRKLDMGKSSELREIREKVENLEKRVEMIEESVMNLRES